MHANFEPKIIRLSNLSSRLDIQTDEHIILFPILILSVLSQVENETVYKRTESENGIWKMWKTALKLNQENDPKNDHFFLKIQLAFEMKRATYCHFGEIVKR